MIILRPHETKLLLPVPRAQWFAPTIVEKDQFGNPGVQTRFRLTAKFRSTIVWRGWFDDRDDADAFLFAIALGTLHNQPALWHLPTPMWVPGMADELSYEFATVTFLTSPTGSNQTYSTPTDWDSGNNYVECLGASGGGGGGNGGSGGGSGGGAYSKVSNLVISGSITYQVGTAGTAGTSTGDGGVGGDTWFNGTTLAASSVGAKGGGPGLKGTGGAGGSGGAAGSGVGDTKYSGGNGAAGVYASHTGAGGGCAGPSGNGGNASTTTGGSSNNGTKAGGSANNVGKAGTEWDATHGCGSGGGGLTGTNTGRVGGLYGGGTSGGASSAGGTGRQGMVVVTYTPVVIVGGNMAMLGM